MNKRKGTPCGCDSDPCGCTPKSQCVKTINGQYPDANHEFGINAGEGVTVTPDGNGIRIGISLASPMVFRGTVGTGGIIATLPPANSDNLGWTCVAISSGSTPDTPPKAYDVGDMLISNGVEWSVVPSSDDPVDWSQIQNKPTTVSGYGITDTYTKSETDTLLGGKVGTTGDQEINGTLRLTKSGQSQLYLKRDIDISTISSSTAMTDIISLANNSNMTPSSDYMYARIQTRRYANRTRIWFSLYRITNGDETALMFEQYDIGRVVLLISNIVNGVATTHTIVDSTP